MTQVTPIPKEGGLRSPQEIIRCLRICRSVGIGCLDGCGKRCSYYKILETGDPVAGGHCCSCVRCLMGDAADALAAAYRKKI